MQTKYLIEHIKILLKTGQGFLHWAVCTARMHHPTSKFKLIVNRTKESMMLYKTGEVGQVIVLASLVVQHCEHKVVIF